VPLVRCSVTGTAIDTHASARRHTFQGFARPRAQLVVPASLIVLRPQGKRAQPEAIWKRTVEIAPQNSPLRGWFRGRAPKLEKKSPAATSSLRSGFRGQSLTRRCVSSRTIDHVNGQRGKVPYPAITSLALLRGARLHSNARRSNRDLLAACCDHGEGHAASPDERKVTERFRYGALGNGD